MFMWADGAAFEWLVNHNQLFEFPPGFDPVPVKGSPSFLGNSSLPEGRLQAANHDFGKF